VTRVVAASWAYSRICEQLAEHHGAAVNPARPAHARAKAQVGCRPDRRVLDVRGSQRLQRVEVAPIGRHPGTGGQVGSWSSVCPFHPSAWRAAESTMLPESMAVQVSPRVDYTYKVIAKPTMLAMDPTRARSANSQCSCNCPPNHGRRPP
jgi:hypothetical protein